MTDQLDQATDSELNEAFAAEVADWVKTVEPWDNGYDTVPQIRWRKRHAVNLKGYWSKLPSDFTTDTNAVLPWLEKHESASAGFDAKRGEWAVAVMPYFEGAGSQWSHSKTFARAAVIALIRAHRALTSSATSSTAPTPPPR